MWPAVWATGSCWCLTELKPGINCSQSFHISLSVKEVACSCCWTQRSMQPGLIQEDELSHWAHMSLSCSVHTCMVHGMRKAHKTQSWENSRASLSHHRSSKQLLQRRDSSVALPETSVENSCAMLEWDFLGYSCPSHPYSCKQLLQFIDSTSWT